MRKPQLIALPNQAEVAQIAAGSRHSAFVARQSRHLYMFGLALHGQLGLGDDCTDRAFKPELVPLPPNLYVDKIALGDSHSLLLTTKGTLYSTGANDKYQLGQNPEQRSLKVFSFTPVLTFKTGDRDSKSLGITEVVFKDIACWNLNCAIDEQGRAYLWGILHDKQVRQSLCIKVPERVNSFKVSTMSIGPTMALLVDKEAGRPSVIGVNARFELGLGDKEQRKTFEVL